jgi:hypothetical protein
MENGKWKMENGMGLTVIIVMRTLFVSAHAVFLIER